MRRNVVPGLSDVARAAGVSTASASRALTRPDLVSDPLRERVRYAAATLGYVANPAARALSSQRSGMVGIVVGSSAGPLGAAVLQATEARLAARGVGALLAIAAASADVAACARGHVARGVDGVIFVGVGAVPEPAGWRARRAFPGVAVGGGGPIASALAIGDGILSRGQSLIRAYLSEYGHVRIGLIGESGETLGTSATDAEPTTATAVITRQIDRIHDVAAMGTAIAAMREQGVTAFCLPDDHAAAGALKACRTMGLAVPGDVSIIGWGDIALARWLTPTLSSVRLPVEQMAGAAVDALFATIGGDDYTCPSLPVKLVVRESSGFAPR